MLSDLMDKRCHLIDYERVVDNGGRRLIFFGWYAGVAGMVESLVALGRRLSTEGIDTPFARLEQPYRYDSIDDMKAVVREVGDAIRKEGLPERVAPMVVGVTGYGNVSRGAQAILDLLPTREISPAEVAKVERGTRGARNIVFKAVYQERDLVRPRDADATFELQHYYDHPEAYVGVFEDHLPHMTMLVNCMYWDARYPRLVTKKFLRDRWADSRLTVVGDIGCDIDGAVEVTHKATEPGAPCYVYEPATDRFADGVSGNGPVIMAVDILPTEMPRESSHHFSQVLTPFAEAIATTDYGAPYDALALPAEIKRALIVHAGRLTPDYAYLSEFLR
jgi:alpha-aminoadipic semialdehyde synthase